MIGSRFVGSSRGVGFGRHPFADDETEEEDGDPGAGLYARAAIGDELTVAHNVHLAPLMNEKSNRTVGPVAILRGLIPQLTFDTVRATEAALTLAVGERRVSSHCELARTCA